MHSKKEGGNFLSDQKWKVQVVDSIEIHINELGLISCLQIIFCVPLMNDFEDTMNWD